MTRTLAKFLSPLTLALATLACEAPPNDVDLEERLDANELLDLDIEQQLEEHTEAELTCNAWPEAEDSLAEYDIAPCIEWTRLTDEPDGDGTDDPIPRAGCTQWQEQYFVETNVSCGGWGGGECSGTSCCTLMLKYVRTCSACPPAVPTSCGSWTYAGTSCACG